MFDLSWKNLYCMFELRIEVKNKKIKEEVMLFGLKKIEISEKIVE